MIQLKKTLLTLTALFALSTGAGATELTVSDGTAETSYFPIAKEYIQCYQKNEMVFPAEDLTAMTGQNITAKPAKLFFGRCTLQSANEGSQLL